MPSTLIPMNRFQKNQNRKSVFFCLNSTGTHESVKTQPHFGWNAWTTFSNSSSSSRLRHTPLPPSPQAAAPLPCVCGGSIARCAFAASALSRFPPRTRRIIPSQIRAQSRPLNKAPCIAFPQQVQPSPANTPSPCPQSAPSKAAASGRFKAAFAADT